MLHPDQCRPWFIDTGYLLNVGRNNLRIIKEVCRGAPGPLQKQLEFEYLHLLSVCDFLPGLQTPAVRPAAAGWCSLSASQNLPRTRSATSESVVSEHIKRQVKLLKNCKQSRYIFPMNQSNSKYPIPLSRPCRDITIIADYVWDLVQSSNS